jgi:hypothetical protein
MSYRSSPYLFNLFNNIVASTTPPDNTEVLWLDTSVEPNLYKVYDSGRWVIANDQNTTMNSVLEMTKQEFKVALSKKVGTDEIVSSINASAEEIKIKSGKIALEGLVTANENFKILEDGSIATKNGTFTGTIEGSTFYTIKIYQIQYTSDDLTILPEIYMSEEEPTTEQLNRYDVNSNGIIDSNDYVRIKNVLDGKYGNTNGLATFEDIVAINMNNSGSIRTERKLNGVTVDYTEINAGSIKKKGDGSIYINGEPVLTEISGTIARFG